MIFKKQKDFYHGILGLDFSETMGALSLQLKGDNKVIIYPKPDHVPAIFTVLNFSVPDIEKAIDDLISLGIRFEQYTGDLQTDEKGIFRGKGPVAAWLKDPAGNILSVMEEK